MERPRTVAVTRPEDPDDPLVQLLADAGASAVAYPLIRIEPPGDSAPLAAAAAAIDSFDLVAFTSRHAVTALFEALDQIGRAPDEALARALVAAVGERTAAELRARRVEAGVVPLTADAGALLRSVAARMPLAASRALLPRSDRARPELPDGLRRAGCLVTEVVAYRTVLDADGAARLGRALTEGAVDLVTFASGSAVDSLTGALGEDAARRVLGRTRVAVLGRTAAAALDRLGVRGYTVATEATARALAAAVLDA